MVDLFSLLIEEIISCFLLSPGVFILSQGVSSPFSQIRGVVTLGSLMAKVGSGKIEGSSPVSQILYSQFKGITLDTTLGKVSTILDKDHFVLVVQTQKQCKSKQEVTETSVKQALAETIL